MKQLLFKNYNGARLALNITYWTADGGRETLGGFSTGGRPAALRAILDKYTRAGFMVHGDGWKEFCADMDQAAARDGKGSQAAEKAAILKGYTPDGDADPGYIFIKKSKMKEAEKMKEAGKVTYKKVNYMVVMLETATGKYHAEPVTGYTRDDLPGLAIRKHTGGTWAAAPWTVDNIEFGCSVVGTGSATRDAAADVVKKHGYIEKINRLLSDPARVADLMKRKKAAEMNCRVDEVPADPEPEKEPETAAEVKPDEVPEKAPEVKAAQAAEPETVQEVKAAEPETVQEVKAAEPVKVQEEKPEEVKKSVMDEVKAGDFSAILQMLGTNKSNTAAIIRAGILEKVFTVPEIVTFLETGRAPAYHTFDVWKKNGYSVRKGEKAAFKAVIWKYTADGGKDAEPETETETDAEEVKAGPDFIHKVSYFFGPSQVEKLEVKKDLETVPDGCKMEVVKGVKWISGDTRRHKETLKAAGYRWSSKRGAWYKF